MRVVDEVLVVDEALLALRQPLRNLFSQGACWRAMNSGLPPSRMSVPRPAMFVAIVTSADTACLGDDFGFLRVVLAFRTTCLPVPPPVIDPQHADGRACSRLLGLFQSTPCREDRTPALCASTMSVTIASHFSCSGAVDGSGFSMRHRPG